MGWRLDVLKENDSVCILYNSVNSDVVNVYSFKSIVDYLTKNYDYTLEKINEKFNFYDIVNFLITHDYVEDIREDKELYIKVFNPTNKEIKDLGMGEFWD